MEKRIKIGVLIVKGDQALLIKEWSNKRDGYFWNFIKGTFEEDLDKSIASCAIREAKEEAGVSIELKNFINCTIKRNENLTTYFNFVATILNGEPQTDSIKNQSERKEDIKEIKWFSKEEILILKNEEFISDMVFTAIHDWLDNKYYPLDVFKEIFYK